MIETENESLSERLAYLEKKVLAQNDEIVCLRSTLADVLRRLTQLEGSRSLSTPPAKNGLYRSNLLRIENILFEQNILIERNGKKNFKLDCLV